MKRQNSRTSSISVWYKVKTAHLFVAAVLLLVGGAAASNAKADTVSQLQAQVNQLSAQNAQSQQNLSSLEQQAASYQDQINLLSSQIASLQAQITANQAKQAQLEAEIQQNEAELEYEKKVLGEDLKAMYVNGQMSSTEMLATSKNLSDFVNAETYRSAVQNKIQDTLNRITELQNQLEAQKTQVEQLLATLSAQQNQLSAEESQQNQLLAMNQDQQAAYNAQIQANQSKISSLEQQIILANLSSAGGVIYGGTCGTPAGDPFANTYPQPLCNSAQDSLVDQWGMYNRECVSYVAWKEASTGHNMPYGLGNAGDWPNHVPGSWIDSSPRVGDAAVRRPIPGYGFWEGGQWVADVGHVMYVEAVNGDGTIAVSQYNASLNGQYSFVASRSAAGLVFIHFP